MTALLPFLKSLFPPSQYDRILVVGGTVRDMLLEKEGSDIDLIAALSPDEFSAAGFRLVETTSGATIYFKHHPEFGKIEVTRIDSIAGLENDLRQRDFTINAMTMNLDGDLFDPLNGKNDVTKRLLRVCGEESFKCDPLRIFRAFRFEADGWRMTPGTETLIRTENWHETLRIMPAERFSNEMFKAMTRITPERFFEKMIEFNVGYEFIPEIFRMPQIPAGPLQHHPEGDLFTHSIQVLQRVASRSEDPLARFCAFFHDLGKLATAPALYPKHHGHDYAGFAMAVDFCNRLRLSTAHRIALAWISSLHGKANLWDTLRDSTKVTIAEQAIKAGIVEILPLVAAADKAGNQPMNGWDETVRIARMNTPELGIDQEKLEAMPAGNRAAFILQQRVNVLRKNASS